MLNDKDDDAANADRTIFIDGTESRMMLAFCERHNCTLEISLGTRKMQTSGTRRRGI